MNIYIPGGPTRFSLSLHPLMDSPHQASQPHPPTPTGVPRLRGTVRAQTVPHRQFGEAFGNPVNAAGDSPSRRLGKVSMRMSPG